MNVLRSVMAVWTLFAACAAHSAPPAAAGIGSTRANNPHLARDTIEASLERGGVAYQYYCARCHGVTAEGNGRAAKLYMPPPANLVTTDKSPAYLELIIRRGGAPLGRSQFMPPWSEELTEEQIRDLVNYIESLSARAKSAK